MRRYLLAAVLALALSATAAENVDGDSDADIGRFCYPAAYKDTRQSCECTGSSAPPWGLRTVNIDCSYKDLHAAQLSEQLPLYADTLDLSWNALSTLPHFASDSLRVLNLLHNNISVLDTRQFVRIAQLRELYLGWNSLQAIAPHAFEQLAHLRTLDLAHNNLHALGAQLFAPLLVLESLSLSWNRQLNQTPGIAQLDFYSSHGISPQLQTLRLEACSLSNLVLPAQAPLRQLHLRRNQLTRLPAQLPRNLSLLDASDNWLEALLPGDTAALPQLLQLLLDDMPRLRAVQDGALAPLRVLQRLSLQNCRRLSSFGAHAFGVDGSSWPPLRELILRGSALRSLNGTLAPLCGALSTLDLKGVPLHCDCLLSWVKELPLETHGRCYKPARLRGLLLSDARGGDDFSCRSWPQWVSCLLILGLILLCSAAIYFIVMGMRPHRGVTLRRRVGAGSPYAPVTIEPNRQEPAAGHNYY